MNVKRAIANYDKRGLYYPKIIKGEIFVDSGNYLMVANPHYRNPKISKIYEFDELYKTYHGYAKGVTIRAKGNPTWNRNALRIIENTFGTEYVTEHDVKITEPMRGKTEAEKETIAEQLIARYSTGAETIAIEKYIPV